MAQHENNNFRKSGFNINNNIIALFLKLSYFKNYRIIKLQIVVLK